jgi:hypothetical protein
VNPDTNLEVFVETGVPQVSSSGIPPAPRSVDDEDFSIGAFSGPALPSKLPRASLLLSR